MKRKKKIQLDNIHTIYALAALVGFAAVLLALWFIYQYIANTSFSGSIVAFPEAKPEESVECTHRHPLNGVCIEKRTEEKIVAVMVENHPDARPQSGIASADVVYEAPVEANYSRFMLLFSESADIEKIGPVRSARPYFLDWVAEYGDAMYVHVGGSPDALERIQDEKINNLNEFYRGWYFWRAQDRYAPHNVYTSTNLLKKALDDYTDSYSEVAFDSWKFEELSSCEENCIQEVEVTFLGNVYKAIWKYNSSTQKYERYQDGTLHLDQNAEKIVADTVIVQKVETEVLDQIGRLGMQTVGGGEAFVFSKGSIVVGRWEKESVSSRTKWLTDTGEEIGLSPGTIWVEVLNQRGNLTFN